MCASNIIVSIGENRGCKKAQIKIKNYLWEKYIVCSNLNAFIKRNLKSLIGIKQGKLQVTICLATNTFV